MDFENSYPAQVYNILNKLNNNSKSKFQIIHTFIFQIIFVYFKLNKYIFLQCIKN